MSWLKSEDGPTSTSKPGPLDWLPTEVLTVALGSADERKEMPTDAADRVQGRSFEMTETHSSLGRSKLGVHDIKNKPTGIQTPVDPLGLMDLGQGNSSSEPRFLTLQNGQKHHIHPRVQINRCPSYLLTRGSL